MKTYYNDEDAGIKIIHGDCEEYIAEMKEGEATLTISDLPYDAKTHEGARMKDKIDFAPLAGAEIAKELLRVSQKWVILFCSLEMLGDYKRVAGESWIRAGVWDRVVNMPQMSGDRPAQGAEGIAIMHRPGRKEWNAGGNAGIWRYEVERGQKEHPCQKPLALMKRLIMDFSTSKDDLICDPYAGSCTTALAALSMGRRCIAVEREEKYCEIGKNRILAYQRQSNLF